MKVITLLILMLSSSFVWANDNDEMGRSLANYDTCTHISEVMNDHQMYFYYKKMFNDLSLGVLALNAQDASHVYDVWLKSELLLRKLNNASMQKMCLSRFDELSRKMLNKIATKKASR
ncbi:hypothetical protein ACLKMH_07935 [Psychromonas sp. KJ10-10]|uniref:hypothetical protein n=1 Tax=Psychromonas sp. KJ10-10 TaxID=3391823 RepID=UPI0039B5917A